jgi:predicted negative regulator of RcsB-dependent stress response
MLGISGLLFTRCTDVLQRTMSSEATQTQSVTIYDVLAWIETNKRALIIGFVAAVVIGFTIAIVRYRSEQREVAASDALLKLKATLSPAEGTAPAEPSAYLKVAQDFPGTAAAERAKYLAAAALFAQGNYTEAQNQFANFVREQPQSPFAATAAYGIATSLEAQGKTDEALAAYQNLAVRYPNASVLDEAKLAIARIHESKKQPEQALRVYDELTKGTAMGTAASEAASRRRTLLAAHPELAKTNAPAVSGATAVVPTSTNVVASPASNAPAAQP